MAEEESPLPAVWSGAVDAQGLPDGAGEMTYPNGDTFSGTMAAGVMTGEGKYTFSADGSVFEGTYANGARVSGRAAFSDGSVYNGAWEGSEISGKGVYEYKDGSKFSGSFSKGKKDGAGKCVIPNATPPMPTPETSETP
jgi:hypothetical protein